jgi:DNA-binding CsgD family transcriptional regulator
MGASIAPVTGARPVVLNIFDQLSVGIVLLDGSAKVVFANAAARSLSDGGPVQLNGGLTSPLPSQARRLADLIRSALSGSSARSMSLPCPDSGRPLMVLVSPLRGADGHGPDDKHDPAAMVMLCDQGHPTRIPAAWIMEAYGLTVAEVRVAIAVSCGATVPDVARRLSISPNTVKTHLRHVFGKTGTSRQVELARLMATIGLAAGSPCDA